MARADFERLQHELDNEIVALFELARATGINPAEVRVALFDLQARYGERLEVLERIVDDDDLVDAMWTFRHRRLHSLVTEQLAAYVKLVAPRPSIASAFAKAAGHVATPLQAAPRVELHRCKTCDAPRSADALYGNCSFCGHPFFTKEID